MKKYYLLIVGLALALPLQLAFAVTDYTDHCAGLGKKDYISITNNSRLIVKIWLAAEVANNSGVLKPEESHAFNLYVPSHNNEIRQKQSPKACVLATAIRISICDADAQGKNCNNTTSNTTTNPMPLPKKRSISISGTALHDLKAN